MDAHGLLLRHLSRGDRELLDRRRGTGGAPCSRWAARRRCWWHSSATGCSEPKRWQERLAQLDRRWTARDAFAALFSPEYRRRTIVNAALLFISMVGLWAGSVYVPSSVRLALAKRRADGARMASYATMLLSLGTIAGA